MTTNQSGNSLLQRGLIVFAHGARNPEWAEPIQRIALLLAKKAPEQMVRAAFMELMTPGLDDAVDELVAAGCLQIFVAPIFLAKGGHLKHDVPEQINRCRQRHPQLLIQLGEVVGESDLVMQAIVDFVVTQAGY